MPFYEQVDEDGVLEGGRLRTVIDWRSYSTSELVERDEDERTVFIVALDAPRGYGDDADVAAADDPVTRGRCRALGADAQPLGGRGDLAGDRARDHLRRGADLEFATTSGAAYGRGAPVAPPKRELVVVPNAAALDAQRRMDSLAAAAVASVVPNAGIEHRARQRSSSRRLGAARRAARRCARRRASADRGNDRQRRR